MDIRTRVLPPTPDWRFCSDDISSWARISGDYNPVHFCLESARLAGSPKIIVHGMLPLVYVKQAIAGAIEVTDFHQNWLKVSCRFRMPMRRDESHDLTITASGRFALHHTDEREHAVLDGSFESHADLSSTGAIDCIDIPAVEANERLSRFAQSLPTVDAVWIAIDSLVFSKLIASDTSLPILQGRRLTEGASTHSELLQQAIALQTTHSVVVSPELLLRGCIDRISQDSIRIALGTPNVVRDTPAMLIGSQPADVLINGNFAMRSEIGFLFKRRASLPT